MSNGMDLAAVFVSHASTDDILVTKLHDALTGAGIDAWVDHIDRIRPGDDWDLEIQGALNAYPAGIAVLSRASIKRHPTRNEWWTILDLGKPLYVAQIESIPKTEFPWWLRTVQYIDLMGDFKAGIARLAAAIQKATSERASATRFGVTGMIPRALTQIPISGREDDLTAIRNGLAKGPTTIVGVGGLGKSRLAAEIVMSAGDIGGAIWHRASDISRTEEVIDLLRTHFALPDKAPREDVFTRLRAERRLVVIDNAESVTDERQKDYVLLIDTLHAAGAWALLTSRVEWEAIVLGQVCHPETLPLPAARQIVLDMAAAYGVPHDLSARADAIARAAKQHPGLIEWEIKLLRRFPVEKVMRDLEALNSKRLQEALYEMVRKTVNQMVSECGPEPGAALRRLAVCRGGFTYDAAQWILDLGSDEDTLVDVLDTLQTWQFVAMHALLDGRTRYTIDPIVLAAVDEDDSAHQAHYAYFTALAKWHDNKQDYLGLDVESENLEAAFEWAMGEGSVEVAYRIYNTCSDFLANRGRFEQRIEWIRRIDAVLKGHPDKDLRANIQNSLGIVYGEYPFGDKHDNLRQSIASFEKALGYWTPDTAPLAYAMAQNNLGEAYRYFAMFEDQAENLRRAVAAHEAALVYWTPDTAPLAYAMTQNNLGNTYWVLSEIEDRVANLQRAVAAYETALVYRTPEVVPLAYATTQNNLGVVYQHLSDVEERVVNWRRALAAYEKALEYRTPEAAPLGYAETQRNMGIVQKQLDDLKAAVVCWQEAERYFREMGMAVDADEMLAWITEAEQSGGIGPKSFGETAG